MNLNPLVSAETVQGIVFLQRQFGTAVDTCIASNYVKLPPPLISYRYCYPVNPFWAETMCRGSEGLALGWQKSLGKKSRWALGFGGPGCASLHPHSPLGWVRSCSPVARGSRNLPQQEQSLLGCAQSSGFTLPGPLVLQFKALIPALKEVSIEQPKLYGLQ